MSPAGGTWGVNNKAGSLSNPETEVTESGTRRETRDKQSKSTRKTKQGKTKKKIGKKSKVANTNQSAPGTDEQERKSERFSNSAGTDIHKQAKEVMLPDPTAFS